MNDAERVGKAIIEIARDLAACGASKCIRLKVLSGDNEATFEVRLVKLQFKRRMQIKASDPEPAGSRQKA